MFIILCIITTVEKHLSDYQKYIRNVFLNKYIIWISIYNLGK